MITSQNYANLEIRIQERQEKGYKIDFTLNHEQEFGPGWLDPATQPNLTGVPDEDGQALFTWLLADTTLQKAWERIRGQHPRRRLRLRIDAAAPELHALPWELLRETAEGTPALDLAAADSTPFSRYLAGAWQPGSPILQRPLKILVAIANPANLQEQYELTPLDVDEEWASLEAATEGVDVKLTLLPQPCTLAALQAELKQGYHVLHYVGHGAFSKRQDRAVLFMADADNQVALVSDGELAEILAGQLVGADTQSVDKLRLIFLASCQTATRSPADAFRGLAPELVAAGVPAVLAMQDLVPIDTAREFSRVFYQRLLTHGLVDLASNEARAALLAAEKPGAAIPVLFMRLRTGLLFGQRGQILGERADGFWDDLLYNIKEGECVPFLGPGVTADLLPNPAELAQTLALENRYPFPDQDNLLKVAQYLGTMNNKRLRRETLRTLVRGFKRRTDPALLHAEAKGRPGELAETIAAAWDELDDQALKSEVHHQLAALDLKIYLTTNFDNCMALALEEVRGVSARQVTVNWQDLLKRTAERPQPKLDPPPTSTEPVVVHLFGADAENADLTSLILSEDDYLDYLSVISRDYAYLLQTDIQEALASNTLLFLGYRLEDMDLKLIMRGLLTHLDLEKWDMPHVAVQIEGNATDPDAEKEVIRFFERYFSNLKIDVYWGSTQQFVADLHARWQEYQ